MASAQPRVVVFGSVNLDLIVHIGHLPAPGETVGGGSFLSAPGGKGANQAIAAARAGAAVSLIGAVGRDAFASQALALLEAARIDLSGLQHLAQPTGTALILVDAKGENQIAVASGANYAFASSAVSDLALQPGSVVLSQLEMGMAATAEVLTKAKAAGARVILNLAPFREEARELLPLAEILVVNQGEGRALAAALGLGEAGDATARQLAEATGRDVIVTLGADGLAAWIGGRDLRVGSLAVTVLDSVGAGDAFCGYLAADLSAKGQLDETSLTLAAAAGALACTRPGAQPAIPIQADVVAALRREVP
ncbi:MAG: ribokinase [Rhodospirillales bacterium]